MIVIQPALLQGASRHNAPGCHTAYGKTRPGMKKKNKKKIALGFHSTTFALVNSNRKQTHKGGTHAPVPDSLFAKKPMVTSVEVIEKPTLDQTIPLRVPAAIKSGLIALAIADGRSLNNWLNLRFAEMVKPTEPAATPNPSLECQNTILDLDELVGGEDACMVQPEPTPHKAVISSTRAKVKRTKKHPFSNAAKAEAAKAAKAKAAKAKAKAKAAKAKAKAKA